MTLTIKTTLSILLLAANLGPAPHRSLARYEYQQNHMGTQFRIVLYADSPQAAEKASSAAFARIEDLNSRLSDYRDDSELNEMCRTAANLPIWVSEDLFRVLSISMQWSELTSGAFDITAAPAIRLWRRARRTKELPDQDDLTKARSLIGYHQLRLDQKSRTARLDKSGVRIDLGGIAKGFAADEAMAVLARAGIDRALIAAGGDIVAGEAPPDSPGWVIGIAPFADSKRPPVANLVLRYAAVSTSGDAQQFVEIESIRYSHIVDPRTGMAIVGAGSVTVVAERGAISDPAATALSVLGPDKGLPLVDSSFKKFGSMSALFVRIVDGKTQTIESRGWKKMMK